MTIKYRKNRSLFAEKVQPVQTDVIKSQKRKLTPETEVSTNCFYCEISSAFEHVFEFRIIVLITPIFVIQLLQESGIKVQKVPERKPGLFCDAFFSIF